jgi:hypothetical protein
MSGRCKGALTVGALVLALVAPASVRADPAKNLGIAGRTLMFLENGPRGAATLGVVFDPSQPASVAEKNAVMAALGSGFVAGSLTLTGRPVPASAIAGVSGVTALYVTGGVNYAAVGAAARAKRLITIGSDRACVKSGACVMWVSGDPKVEIVINRAAAAAVGAAFRAAFLMMIHEV